MMVAVRLRIRSLSGARLSGLRLVRSIRADARVFYCWLGSMSRYACVGAFYGARHLCNARGPVRVVSWALKLRKRNQCRSGGASMTILDHRSKTNSGMRQDEGTQTADHKARVRAAARRVAEASSELNRRLA